MNIDIHSTPRARRSGYTLVEMLLSVVLTLMLMYGVAQIFSIVGNSVNDARALLGLSDRLRATKARLQLDLDGVTSSMTPPAKPGDNEGYFELIEGPVGPTVSIETRAISTDEAGNPQPDTTAIDYDDILMFTTQSTSDAPFIGRAGPDATVQSRFAEVAWFVRGRTLYRRVKIINPDYNAISLNCQDLYGNDLSPTLANFVPATSILANAGVPQEQAAFENLFDLSVRLEGNPNNPADQSAWKWVPNSLSDLTMRENRMYHAPITPGISGTVTRTNYLTNRFPFSPHDRPWWQILGLPTLAETSNLNWMFYQWNRLGTVGGPELPDISLKDDQVPDLNMLAPVTTHFQLDFWNAPYPYPLELDTITGNLTGEALRAAISAPALYQNQRIGEDVILNNVIGFDVKVWDPEAPVIANNMGTSELSDDKILRPGDPGFPKNYVLYTAGGQEYVRDLNPPLPLTPPVDYAIVSRGAFVDLGQNYRPRESGYSLVSGEDHFPSRFCGRMDQKSGLPNPIVAGTWTDPPATTPPFVYDTWSTHYEFDGINQNGGTAPDLGFNGLDDDSDNLVDDEDELDTLPPYPTPLTAIQIKIRVFEPKSRQVREVTIVHHF